MINPEFLKAAEMAGYSPAQAEEMVKAFSGLLEVGKKGIENRLALLRALAELARENEKARSIVEKLLRPIEVRMPEESATFRVYYLEGKRKETARQIARRLCMDPVTVYHHNRRVLKAMLPSAFGIFGLFCTDAERDRGDGAVEGEGP